MKTKTTDEQALVIKDLISSNNEHCQIVDKVTVMLSDIEAVLNSSRIIKTRDSTIEKLEYKLSLIESCVIHGYPKNGEVLAGVIEDIIKGEITGHLPEHNTDSNECWCQPTIEDNNGAKLIIHHKPT